MLTQEKLLLVWRGTVQELSNAPGRIWNTTRKSHASHSEHTGGGLLCTKGGCVENDEDVPEEVQSQEGLQLTDDHQLDSA